MLRKCIVLAIGRHGCRLPKNAEVFAKQKLLRLATAWMLLLITVLVGCTGKKETGAPDDFVRINGGTFTMGSPANEAGRKDDEVQHQVTVSSFYMGKYEVTQKEWTAVMGSNPSSFQGDNLPVEMVSWYDALVFCNTLSISEGLTPAYSINGKTNPNDWGTVPTNRDATWNAVTIVANSNGYRLPTEAQWEYACRAGTTTAYNTGDTISDNTGWYDDNSGDKTNEVGKKPPNAWGLYDMHGNVFEWCWDWYGDYSSGAQTDPTGASSGDYRVIRSGSWNYSAEDVRSAYRINTDPSSQFSNLGIRLARPYADSGEVAASGQEAQEITLPPVVDLFQYDEIRYHAGTLLSPSSVNHRTWGWSKDGKVAYSNIIKAGEFDLYVKILNLVDNTIIWEERVSRLGSDADDNVLPPTDFDEFREVCIQNGIEFVQAEYRSLPINHNGRTYNVILEKTKTDMDGAEVVEYRIVAETQGKRKTVLVRTEDYIIDIILLGYFISPFENRAMLVMGSHVWGNYFFTDFAGIDLDSGFTALEAQQLRWDEEPTVTEDGDQIWQGHSNYTNITATWNRGTLTINGDGAIEGNYYDYKNYPWTEEKEKPSLEIFNVIINDGVTAIEDNAFYFKQLESVTIPDSVTRIGADAFYNNNLTGVLIPDSVTFIGVAAFFHNPLVSITIGANVELENDHTRSVPYAFPDNFDDAYNKNGKQAGTYTLNNGIWTKQ